jgi:hypothetical protein
MEARLELKLHPKRAKQVALFTVCAAFSAVAFLMVRAGKTAGWLPLALFGLGGFVFALQLLPGASYLKLDPEGLTVQSLFRSSSFAWAEIAGFSPGLVRGVVFDLVPGSKRQSRLRRFNSAALGAECALPDTYGLSAERLADLLNEWKLGARRLDT